METCGSVIVLAVGLKYVPSHCAEMTEAEIKEITASMKIETRFFMKIFERVIRGFSGRDGFRAEVYS
jgi:hypothetical protein